MSTRRILSALAAASAWIVTTRAGVLVQVAAVLVLLLGWGAASQRDVRSMLAMRRR